MRTIIGSFRRDCVLIILLQLYGSEAALFESNLFYLSGLIWPTGGNLFYLSGLIWPTGGRSYQPSIWKKN